MKIDTMCTTSSISAGIDVDRWCGGDDIAIGIGEPVTIYVHMNREQAMVLARRLFDLATAPLVKEAQTEEPASTVAA